MITYKLPFILPIYRNLIVIQLYKYYIFVTRLVFRADKCVTVNEEEQVYYDYLFLLYGEQFGYSVEESETKSDTSFK